MSRTTRRTKHSYEFRKSHMADWRAAHENRDIEQEFGYRLGTRRTSTSRLVHPWEDIYKSWLSDKWQWAAVCV